ncbi:MAG: hypothetical protein O2884_11455 [Chloroflexi bacterium]|nr:hypothetical protein [Chloroflexota bacterium]
MPPNPEYVQALADTIADYRSGDDEVAPRSPELVEQWAAQFPAEVQSDVLSSLLYTFERTYVSQTDFEHFLGALASTDKLSPGVDPAEYWKHANLLDIQQGGASQKEILHLFDGVLKSIHGFGADDTGSEDGDFIYLDDCIATGSRVRSDLVQWVKEDAPKHSRIKIITPAHYRGTFWIDGHIARAAKDAGKTVRINKWFWPSLELENRKARKSQSDVLWPDSIPTGDSVAAYVTQLEDAGYPPELRTLGQVGSAGLFRDDAAKVTLEREFLRRGCEIRATSPNLPAKMRPLGYHNLECLGFESMVVTYRNCPNNCPLVLWVDQPGIPALLPRKTNTDVEIGKLIRGI